MNVCSPSAGGEQYSGEPVYPASMPCRLPLAEAEGADDGLVTASLLHDPGHLLHDLGDTPPGVDDVHQYRALPFLRGLFGDRYWTASSCMLTPSAHLCALDSGYYAALSDDSKRSLALQGGVFDDGQAALFIRTTGCCRCGAPAPAGTTWPRSPA